MIITIDGPIATGKSTIAKAVAREVGFIYIDTGAMYRCLTYGLLKNKIDLDHKQAIGDYLKDFKFVMKIKHGEKRYFVDDEDVTDKIRLAEVTAAVSKISALREVREKLVALQQELALGVHAVVEGRDMGTVVFPTAEIKIFLTGRPEIRAKRRFDELRALYPTQTAGLTLEQTIDEINKRDAYDMSREISPLVNAADALVIDTSELSIPEIVSRILEFKDTLKTRQPRK